LREKDITLALALALRDKLLAAGGVRVALTRESDRYLMLEERSGIARQLKADLFVSIHADSSEAADASGATLYTLSDRGSSQEASRIAARENRADTVDGVPLAGTSNAVSAILVDLSQRHAGAQSTRFAELALREGKDRSTFAPDLAIGGLRGAEGSGRALGAVRGGLYLQRERQRAPRLARGARGFRRSHGSGHPRLFRA
jgi:N-acetylmuramoyl-L-alanine amidase